MKTFSFACAAVTAVLLASPAFAAPETSPEAFAGRSGSQSQASIPMAEGARNYALDQQIGCQTLIDKAGSMPAGQVRDSQKDRALEQEDLARQALNAGDEQSCRVHVRAAIDAMSSL